MITIPELQFLRANPRFLTIEMQRRSIQVEVLDWEKDLLIARYQDHQELIANIDSSIMPYVSSITGSNKSIAKHLISNAGLSVPRGSKVLANELTEAVNIAGQIGYPVVVKPIFGEQGQLVHLDIYDEIDLQYALINILDKKGNVECLIEEQFAGKEYRIFITKNNDYAVLHRDPAHVIGDGKSSIRSLATKETFRRMNPRTNCLCPIVLDDEVERYLRRNCYNLDYIPKLKQKIYLRSSSNLMMGGICEDFTDLIHPSALDIARRALNSIPHLPYAGIDLMCEDITSEQDTKTYRIIEINTLPGIAMHTAPAIGTARNVPGMIVDLIFPETKVCK